MLWEFVQKHINNRKRQVVCCLLSGVCFQEGAYAKSYEAGSITFKPLIVDFYDFTFGSKKHSSYINTRPVSIYRDAEFAPLGARADRNGVGYDIELGYMITQSLEAFALAGFTIEKPHKKVGVANIPAPLVNYFDFKKRYSYSAFLGGRYYWGLEGAWTPFVGGSLGVIWQEKTKAKLFSGPANAVAYTPIGKFEALKSKWFMSGDFQVGVDYEFTKTWHLTLMSGAQYHPRAKTKKSRISNRTVYYRDNWNRWSIPVSAAVKIVF